MSAAHTGGGGPGGAAGTGPGGPQGPIDPVRAAENNLPAVLAPMTIVHFLAVAVVLLRLYTRIVIIKSPGRDDWVMLAAMVWHTPPHERLPGLKRKSAPDGS